MDMGMDVGMPPEERPSPRESDWPARRRSERRAILVGPLPPESASSTVSVPLQTTSARASTRVETYETISVSVAPHACGGGGGVDECGVDSPCPCMCADGL